MRFLSYFFFYTYVGFLIAAGVWGALLGARIDQQMLFAFDISVTDPGTEASLLSQYRFLRLVEAGFGLFAILFTKEIFSEPKFNKLFLFVMFMGAGVRILSYFEDGSPYWIFYFFAIYELIGAVIILIHTRKQLSPYPYAS